MASITVQPRDTPGERAGTPVQVELDEALSVIANQLEEWVAPLTHWELQLREGHEFDRPDNVEARLLFTGAAHTCSARFRLDPGDSLQALARDLWLVLEGRDGIAKGLHLAPNGLDVELFHIVGPPLGGTSA